jgi:hypothetical protein
MHNPSQHLFGRSTTSDTDARSGGRNDSVGVSGGSVGLQAHESRLLKVWALALVLLFVTSTTAAQTWKASDFHGVKPGKSTKADVTKAFGDPAEVRKPSLAAFANDACCEELLYHGKGDNGGELSIAIRKNGAVVYILDQFKSAMPRSTAYRKYGKDWHDHAYSSAKCAERAGIAPLYRDPAGPIELVEYPDKGMLFWPSNNGYDFFGSVYTASAPGLLKPPPCVTSKH